VPVADGSPGREKRGRLHAGNDRGRHPDDFTSNEVGPFSENAIEAAPNARQRRHVRCMPPHEPPKNFKGWGPEIWEESMRLESPHL